MNKFKFGRNLKYGAGTSVITAIILAVIIIVNLSLQVLSQKYPLKADLTKHQIYKLSEYTENVLKDLQNDINIYTLYSNQNSDNSVMEIIYRYQRSSDKIHVNVINPESDPSFSVKYDKENKGLSEGTIIFECGEKFTTVTDSELTNYSMYTQEATTLYAEEKFTQAIAYVTKTESDKIYYITGHGDDTANEFSDVLPRENYEKLPISLLTQEIPKDASTLMILSPSKDFSSAEIEKLDNYLVAGGSLFITLNPVVKKLDTLESYLSEWGITTGEEIVYETNTERVAFNIPYTFYATNAGHEITANIFSNNYPILVADNKPIYLKNVEGFDNKALLSTSDGGTVKDLNSTDNAAKSVGKITIAATSQKGNGKIAVFGSNQYLINTLFKESSIANKELFLNTVNWLSGSSKNTGIRPKNIASDMLTLTSKSTVIVIALVAIIPILIIIIGIFVWIRRRHL